MEEPKDVVAIERTREFTGRYHVLGGAISPIDGIGPEQLRVAELMARLAGEEITEVIIATDPNIEGEATAAYLSDWGERAAMGLRVLHGLISHVRLDADEDLVAEAEFDALHP